MTLGEGGWWGREWKDSSGTLQKIHAGMNNQTTHRYPEVSVSIWESERWLKFWEPLWSPDKEKGSKAELPSMLNLHGGRREWRQQWSGWEWSTRQVLADTAWLWKWGHNRANTLKTIHGWIIWYVNYTSVNLVPPPKKKKKKEKEDIPISIFLVFNIISHH